MKFSFLSWNVRQYQGNPARLSDADALITSLNPDIFGLIEFRAKKEVRKLMLDSFPEYDFAVTDSKAGLELTIGFRRGKFDQVIWTQKRDFMVRNQYLRPGGLISVRTQDAFYNLLFLHTKSGTTKRDYKTRELMFNKIWKLKAALRKVSSTGNENLIVLGDLNTMGWSRKVLGKQEINDLSKRATKENMVLARKDQNETWHQWSTGRLGKQQKLTLRDLPRAKRSDLDHVIHSSNLAIRGQFPMVDKVHVLGWNQLAGQVRIDFLWDLSDHSAIFGRVL